MLFASTASTATSTRPARTTPDGTPDPRIFSTHDDPVGIQVGTAIATLVRKAEHRPAKTVDFRHLWGASKHDELTATAEAPPQDLYGAITPLLPLGLPLADMAVSEGWQDWPSLPDLFPTSFPGVKTSRDGFLVDIDRDRLKQRVGDYFDSALTHEEIARRHPSVMQSSSKFNAQAIRDTLLKRGGPDEDGFVPYSYRPFDTRWLYWEADNGLLDRPRPTYQPHVFNGNLWLEAREKEARPHFSRGTFCRHLSDNFGNGLSIFSPRGSWNTVWWHLGVVGNPGPMCRSRPKSIWIVWDWMLWICSTMCSPRYTTPHIARPMRERSGWRGRASPCRAGPTATAMPQRQSWLHQPRKVENSPRCWTPTPRSPA